MVWEIWVQSQISSYQRLEKWYLIPLCLTVSNIRYVSRVKWSNLGKGVAPSPTPRCSRYLKRESSGRPRLRSPTLLINCQNYVICVVSDEALPKQKRSIVKQGTIGVFSVCVWVGLLGRSDHCLLQMFYSSFLYN